MLLITIHTFMHLTIWTTQHFLPLHSKFTLLEYIFIYIFTPKSCQKLDCVNTLDSFEVTFFTPIVLDEYKFGYVMESWPCFYDRFQALFLWFSSNCQQNIPFSIECWITSKKKLFKSFSIYLGNEIPTEQSVTIVWVWCIMNTVI